MGWNPFKSSQPAKKPRKYAPRKPKSELSFDEVLERSLITKARKDKQWAEEEALKKFGFTSEPGADLDLLKRTVLSEELANDPDFREKVKQEYLASLVPPEPPVSEQLRDRIEEMALDKIESDPALLDKAVGRTVADIVGAKDRGSMWGEILADEEAREEVLQRLGGGNKSTLGQLLDPEIIKAVLGVAQAWITKGQVATGKTYVIESKEGVFETDLAGYRKYLEGREREQLPSPKPETKPEEVATEAATTLKLDELVAYLDNTPEEFIYNLMDKMAVGDTQAQLVWGMLSSMTADEMFAKIAPYKENEKIKPYIEKLEAKKEWLEKSISFLKVITTEGIK